MCLIVRDFLFTFVIGSITYNIYVFVYVSLYHGTHAYI